MTGNSQHPRLDSWRGGWPAVASQRGGFLCDMNSPPVSTGQVRSSATHMEALAEIRSSVNDIVSTQRCPYLLTRGARHRSARLPSPALTISSSCLPNRLLSQHQAALSDKLCGSVEKAGAMCAHLRDLEEEKLSISAVERWIEKTCEVGAEVVSITADSNASSFLRVQDMAQLRAQALFLNKVVSYLPTYLPAYLYIN